MSDVIAPLRWFFRIAAVLALIAGLQLFAGAAETDRFFSWTIEPPLTAAFLGAAYWAAFVLLAWAAVQESWSYARTVIPPVFTIALLLLVATLLHLDKFDLDSLFGWFWLSVYVLVVPFLAIALAAQARRAPAVQRVGERIRPWLRAALSVQAALMLFVGAALFALGDEAADLWPWPLTPLTARAVGAFMAGFGVAAAFAVRDDDLARLRGCALAYAALGALELAAVAIQSDDVDAGGAHVAGYLALWVSVLAVGAYGFARSRSAVSASSGSR